MNQNSSRPLTSSRFLLALPLLFLVSCAGIEKTAPNQVKTYSAETEKTFEEIEREQVLESYRKLRWENWQKREAERERQRRRANIYRPRTPKKTPPPKPARVAPKPSGNPEEIQVEIEQNMAIYCMKMGGSSRFENETECTAFAQNILFECSSKYDEDDKRRVNCVKSSLR